MSILSTRFLKPFTRQCPPMRNVDESYFNCVLWETFVQLLSLDHGHLSFEAVVKKYPEVFTIAMYKMALKREEANLKCFAIYPLRRHMVDRFVHMDERTLNVFTESENGMETTPSRLVMYFIWGNFRKDGGSCRHLTPTGFRFTSNN